MPSVSPGWQSGGGLPVVLDPPEVLPEVLPELALTWPVVSLPVLVPGPPVDDVEVVAPPVDWPSVALAEPSVAELLSVPLALTLVVGTPVEAVVSLVEAVVTDVEPCVPEALAEVLASSPQAANARVRPERQVKSRGLSMTPG
jgi:hypothetical protein